MKIKKPLMVKLSAGLLTACGVFLPVATQAGWNETPGNDWILSGIGTIQDYAVVVAVNRSATIQANSSWGTFDPWFDDQTAAIIFNEDGRLVFDGGDITVDGQGYNSDIYGVFSSTGSLAIGNWASASELNVLVTDNYDYHNAYGIKARELVFSNLEATPVSLSGSLIVNSESYAGDATGLLADENITISGNLSGTIDVSGHAYVIGLNAGAGDSGFLTITGNLSGTVTALASGYGDGHGYSYAEATGLDAEDGILIGGDFSGTINATATNSQGSYEGYADATGINGCCGPVTIAGVFSGSVIVQATAEGIGNSYTSATGLYADDGSLTIGSIGSTGVITATATASGLESGASAYGIYLGEAAYDSDLGQDIPANLIINGDMAGTITATATADAGDEAEAAGFDVTEGSILISGNLSGKVTVNSSGVAFGLVASQPQPNGSPAPDDSGLSTMGNITIAGDVSGTVAVTGVNQAFGLAAMNVLTIKGNVTSTAVIDIEATGVNGDAYGLATMNVLTIGTLPAILTVADGGDEVPPTTGDLAGTITVNAGHDAFGLFAGYIADGGTPPPVAPPTNYEGFFDAQSINILGNIAATSSITVIAGNEAYGICADEDISIAGNVAGTIVANGGNYAAGIYTEYDELEIHGDLGGSITVTGGNDADGLYAGCDLWIGGNVTGTITVTGGKLPDGDSGKNGSAYGLTSAYDITIGTTVSSNNFVTGATGGDLGGSITVNAIGDDWGNEAYGLYAGWDGDGGNIDIIGSVTATIKVDSSHDDAMGLYADGDINIGTRIYTSDGAETPTYTMTSIYGGNLGGTITVTSAHDDAYGLNADADDINIQGNVTGTITVTGGDYAYGLYADDEINILGEISGTITVASTGTDDIYAYGMYSTNGAIAIGDIIKGGDISATATATANVSNSYAYGMYVADADVKIGTDDDPAMFSGSISALAEDSATGIYADGVIRIKGNLSGAISATATPQGTDTLGVVSPQAQAVGLYGNHGVTITGILSGSVTAQASTNYNGPWSYRTEAIGIRGDVVVTLPAPSSPPPVNTSLNGIDIGSITGSITASSLIDIDEDGDGTGSRSSYAYGLKSNASISIGGLAKVAGASATDSATVMPNGLGGFIATNLPAVVIGDEAAKIDTYNIKAEATGRASAYAYGLYAEGGVTLGSLEITETTKTPLNVLLSGTANIVATARATDYVSNSYAYGVYAKGNVNIIGEDAASANLAGSILAAAEDEACAIRSNGVIDINGNVSGLALALAIPMGNWADDKSPSANAVALYGEDGVSIAGDVSGLVVAVAATNFNGSGSPQATGIKSDSGAITIGSISGTILACAINADGDTGGDGDAYGLHASQTITIGTMTNASPTAPVAPIFTGGDISGSIEASAADMAYGLYADDGITILGNITSAAKITATGGNKAQGIRCNDNIMIGGDMAGTITATSASGNAAGIYSDGDIEIGGKLSGTITVTAENDAFGIHAGDTLDSIGGALEITGTVSASGTSDSDGVKAICAHGAMNLKISGTVEAYNDDGTAYAIKGLNSANDTVELTTGASITGTIDLGDNNNPGSAPSSSPAPLPVGDWLILTGHNSHDGEINNVETLDINADADGWKLTYNCNAFDTINFNTGTFGISSGDQINHIHATNYNQSAGTTLAIQYDADGDSNDTIYTDHAPGGVATVDGTVRIVPVGYMTTMKQTYTFIDTDNQIVGTYATLEKPAIVAAELQKSDDGTDYQFTAARRTFTSFDDGIGTAMDKLYEEGYDTELMNLFLGMGTDGQVTDALRQLDAITAPTAVALSGSQAFSAEITARLSAMRQGIAMARKNPNLGNLPTLAATGNAEIGEALRAAQMARAENHEWQVTGRYIGNYGSLDSDTNANGGDWKGHGFMIDVDRMITENLILGIGAGGSWTTVDVDNNGGEADVESFNARLYATWFDGPWHVDAQIGYGRNSNESTRNITLFGPMQAKGEWDADVYTAALAAGYDLELGKGWILEPNAAIDYTRIANDSYTETGADPFNLAVDSNEFDSLRSTIGLALRKDFNLSNGAILRPELRIGWKHEFLDDQVSTGATFFGSSFTSYGVKQDRDSATIGLGLNMQFNQALGGYVSYDAELNSQKTIQSVSIGIRYNF